MELTLDLILRLMELTSGAADEGDVIVEASIPVINPLTDGSSCSVSGEDSIALVVVVVDLQIVLK